MCAILNLTVLFSMIVNQLFLTCFNVPPRILTFLLMLFEMSILDKSSQLNVFYYHIAHIATN